MVIQNMVSVQIRQNELLSSLRGNIESMISNGNHIYINSNIVQKYHGHYLNNLFGQIELSFGIPQNQ